jgi:hypothetical protein
VFQQLIQQALDFKPLNIPIGPGVVYDGSVSLADTLMLIIQSQLGLPKEMSGLLLAYLVSNVDAVKNLLGGELSKLIALGSVYLTSRELLDLEGNIKGLVGQVVTLDQATQGRLPAAATNVMPRALPAPPVAPVTDLESQLNAITV